MNAARFLLRLVLIIIISAGLISSRALEPETTTLLVTTTVDEYSNPGPGSGCSLREAISAANTDSGFGGCQAGSGTDIIQVPPGTYQLGIAGAGDSTNATGDLDISSNLSIIGLGSGAEIQANGIDRVLDIQSMATVTLNHLTLSGGILPDTVGGSDSAGGGIRSAGTLTLTSVQVNNNHAGKVESTVETRIVGGMGGGIASSGSLTLTNSSISGNHAGDGLNHNYDYGADGGSGGGIAVTAGSLSVTNSTITGNTAGASLPIQTGWGGDGGGIYINGSTATITSSTISLNTAGASNRDYGGFGGGIYAVTDFSLFNSTVSGNMSGQGGWVYGGPGGGCGIYAENNAIIRYSTIYNNHSATGSDASQSNGGGINAMNLTMGASIVAGNSVWKDIHPNIVVYGTSTSEDYNVIGWINYGWAFTDGSTVNSFLNMTEYSLEALDDYGGPTKTHAILSTNLAVDKIPSGTLGCGTTFSRDQRGYYRPRDGNSDGTSACDIGAYESFVNTAPVAVADNYSTGYGTPLIVDAVDGLLANDTDVDGGSLAAELVSGPNSDQGALSLATDGSFTFTPAGGFIGDATFTYRADDGVGGFSPAVLVTIQVTNSYLYLPLIWK